MPHNRTLAADPAPHGSWRQLVEAVEQVEALRAERDESVINQAARGRASASLLEAQGGREPALLAGAHAEALAPARGGAAEKELLLLGELEKMRASHGRLVEALEAKGACAAAGSARS